MNHLQKTQQPLLQHSSLLDLKPTRTKYESDNPQSIEYGSQKCIAGLLTQPFRNNKTSSYEPLLTDSHSISSSFQEERSKLLPIDQHLYLMMKQQIDIAATNYRQKTNGLIKAQAQEIQKLSYAIISHTHIINKQTQIIKKLREADLNSTKIDAYSNDGREFARTTSKSPSKLSLTQKKIVTKTGHSPIKDMKIDIESRVQMLNRRLDEVSTQIQQISLKNREVLLKINAIDRQLSKNIFQRLNTTKQQIISFCEQNQTRINKIDCQLSNKNAEKQEVHSKISILHEEVEEIRSLVYSISQREFVYDSYPLDMMRSELQKIAKKVEELSKDCMEPSAMTSHQVQASHSLGFSQRFAKENPVYEQALNRSQLSSLSHYAPKYVKAVEEDRVKRSSEWQPEESGSSFSSEEDDFFYPEVHSQVVISEQSKNDRLERIISRQNSRKLPVRVQIDQTGYIKYYNTGMYILDDNGDGFDLSGGEIRALKDKGVIFF